MYFNTISFSLLQKPDKYKSCLQSTEQLKISNEQKSSSNLKDGSETQKNKTTTSSGGFDLRDKLRKSKVTSQQCLSDSETLEEGVQRSLRELKGSTQSAKSDSECLSKSNRSETRGFKKLQGHSVSFWPLYKKWTEVRCYSDYELIERHLNQLFIRGDNVVSISVEDG